MSSNAREDAYLPYLLVRVALKSVRLKTMAVYLELLTGLRIGDEYCSTVEQFQNHVGTIPSGAQLSREEFEAGIVEPDLVADLE